MEWGWGAEAGAENQGASKGRRCPNLSSHRQHPHLTLPVQAGSADICNSCTWPASALASYLSTSPLDQDCPPLLTSECAGQSQRGEQQCSFLYSAHKFGFLKSQRLLYWAEYFSVLFREPYDSLMEAVSQPLPERGSLSERPLVSTVTGRRSCFRTQGESPPGAWDLEN